MATFRGMLEVEGDPDSSLVADVVVADGRISLRAGNAEIGAWDLNAHFLDCIRRGLPPETNFDDALKTMALVDAVYSSQI